MNLLIIGYLVNTVLCRWSLKFVINFVEEGKVHIENSTKGFKTFCEVICWLPIVNLLFPLWRTYWITKSILTSK